MVNEAENRYLRIYCPTHKTTFRAVSSPNILCESGEEALAQDFPYGTPWEYCCDCLTYWPVDLLRSSKGRSECPVCNRSLAKRYLCDNCKLLSLESSDHTRLKPFVLSSNGAPHPACPGCLNPPKRSTLCQHHCADIEVEFATARPDCPFCEEVIQAQVVPKKKPRVDHNSKKLQASSPSLERITYVKVAPTSAPGNLPLQPREVVYAPDNGWKPSKDISPSSLIRPSLPASTVKPTRKSIRVIVFGTVVAVSTIVYFAAVMWRLNTSSDRKTEISRPEPPSGMTYVQTGEFVMGTNNGDEYERPEHKVTVRAFYIDLYEVTCEDYEKFVRATGRSSPPNWKNNKYPDGTARWPVTGVNWDDASAYAKWAGKRLPTEEEWEFAARGSDGRRYPWGDEWKAGAANADASSQGHLVDVGLFPAGKSPSGAFDMVGNAWEWTASDLTAYPGGKLPERPTGDLKIIRGGSFQSKKKSASTTYRWGYPARKAGDYSGTSFRCAKDVIPAERPSP
jgi:formylglycine-generating enzyme required for sulfatase activity